MKKKKKILQEMQDAERVKAIVDSGELATDTEVYLDESSEALDVANKSSEAVVNEYLGEIELTHDDDADDLTNSETLFSDNDNPSDNKTDLLAPSETTKRPFLKEAKDGGLISVKDTPPEIGNPYPDSNSMLAG